MSILNFLQCSGNFILPNVSAEYLKILRGLLETGVKFWQPNGTENPMTKNILNNRRIK